MTVRPNPTARRLTDLSEPGGTISGNSDGFHAQTPRPDGPENFDNEPVPHRTGECRDLTELLWGSGADAVFKRR